MTPKQLKIFRAALKLSAEGFARLTGTRDGRTVRRWEAGDNPIPGAVAQLVRLLQSMPAPARAAAVELLLQDP